MKFLVKGTAVAAAAATLLMAGCSCMMQPGKTAADQSAGSCVVTTGGMCPPVNSQAQGQDGQGQQGAQATPVSQAVMMKDRGSCKGYKSSKTQNSAQ